MIKLTFQAIMLSLPLATYSYAEKPSETINESKTKSADRVPQYVAEDNYLSYSIPADAYQSAPVHDRSPSHLLVEYYDRKPTPGKVEAKHIGTDTLLTRKNKNILIERNLFKNGKKHGMQRTWYESGVLMSEEPYKNGVMNGVFKHWDETGKLVGCYKMMEGTGVKIIYYPNGRLREERGYRNNDKYGMQYTFHDNGQIEFYEEYKLEGLVGNSFLFYSTGEPQTIYAHQRNKAWDILEATCIIVDFDENGKVDGDIVYRVNGDEVSEDNYQKLFKGNPTFPKYEQNPDDYKKLVDDRVKAIIKKYKEMPPVKIPLEPPKEVAK
jgi:antitoxin component YwqK of YwqJK toxin-antitoxin module